MWDFIKNNKTLHATALQVVSCGACVGVGSCLVVMGAGGVVLGPASPAVGAFMGYIWGAATTSALDRYKSEEELEVEFQRGRASAREEFELLRATLNELKSL